MSTYIQLTDTVQIELKEHPPTGVTIFISFQRLAEKMKKYGVQLGIPIGDSEKVIGFSFDKKLIGLNIHIDKK